MIMFAYTLWMCTTVYNNLKKKGKKKSRKLACTHPVFCWRANQIRLRQINFYCLAMSTIHATHFSHAHTRSLTSGCCVYRMTLRVCGCVPVSSASTEQSLLTRPWFVLGTASWVTTPPEREREHNENRKPILRWQKKKSQGKMAYVVLQPQWH